MSEYQVNLRLEAELVVPAGRLDPALPEWAFKFYVGTLGDMKVEAQTLAALDGTIPIQLEEMPKTIEELMLKVGKACADACNIGTRIERGDLTLEKVVELLRQRSEPGIDISEDCDEGTRARLAELGLVTPHKPGGGLNADT